MRKPHHPPTTTTASFCGQLILPQGQCSGVLCGDHSCPALPIGSLSSLLSPLTASPWTRPELPGVSASPCGTSGLRPSSLEAVPGDSSQTRVHWFPAEPLVTSPRLIYLQGHCWGCSQEEALTNGELSARPLGEASHTPTAERCTGSLPPWRGNVSS